MSRGPLGYVGDINGTGFKQNAYEGIASLSDLAVIQQFTPMPSSTLYKPNAYSEFGTDPTTTALTISDLETGYLLDGNAGAPAAVGGYKLVVGTDMRLEFHIWGAGGAGAHGGHSGYTKYTADFSADDEIGLYLPGWDGVPNSNATRQTACWPDGGHGGTGSSNHGYSGGGSARVGTWYTNLSNMNASAAVYYAIAGGGGGAHVHNNGPPGNGGGTSGTDSDDGSYSAGGGEGGTQSAGGSGGAASSYGGTGQDGSKYQGGNGVAYSVYGGGGGGGGGYYGGGAGGTVYACGGGGSGYVNTGFSGYVSGTTYAGGNSSPAGVGYTKPTNAGESNSRGAIFFKKV